MAATTMVLQSYYYINAEGRENPYAIWQNHNLTSHWFQISRGKVMINKTYLSTPEKQARSMEAGGLL
jgi:hypothetical protein